jgi:hypothetical protein
MASKHNEGSSGAVALTVILILMALAKEMPRLDRRLTAWQVKPVTAAGVLAQSAYMRFANHFTLFGKACSHAAMNLLILLANTMRPCVMWLAPICVMVAMIPWLARRFGPSRYWASEPLIAAALVMGLSGVGFGLAMPAAWPWLLVAFGWAVSAANAATALYYLVLAAMAWRDGTRTTARGGFSTGRCSRCR